MTEGDATRAAEEGVGRIRGRAELYRLVLENVSDLITLVGPDGRILYASPSHEETLGYHPAELVGQTLDSFIHPGDLRLALEHRKSAIAAGRAEASPVRIRRSDGGWALVEAILAPIADEETRGTILLSTARDVGPRLEVEAALRESRDLFESILGAVVDGITVLDGAGKFVYVNEPGLELIGVESAEELQRLPADEVLARFELLDEWGAPLPPERLTSRRVLLGEPAAEERVRYRVRATGQERLSVVRSLPVGSVDGRPRLVINVFHDVTEQERGERRLRFLADVSVLLGSSLDYEATLRSLSSVVVPELADWYGVDLLEPDGTLRRIAVAHVDPAREEHVRQLAERYPPLVDAESIAQRAVRTKEPQLLAEISDELLAQTAEGRPGLLEAIRELGLCSAIVVPLVVRDVALGAISLVYAESGRRYGPDELELAQELARRSAVAVENARLYRREQEAREDAEAAARTVRRLERVTEAALAHLSLEDLLNELLARLVELLDADTGSILLLDEDGNALVSRASVGFGSELEHAVEVPLGEGLSGEVAQSRESIVVSDLGERELVSPVLRERGVRSLVAVPLVVEGEAIGVFHVGSLEPDRFDRDDARLLELAADRIALAINQARLYEAEREARAAAQAAQERLAFLAEASDVLASSLDYERTLGSLARLVVPRLADWCAVHVADEGALETVSVVTSGGDLPAGGPQALDPAAHGGISEVIRSGEPLLVPVVSAELVERLAAERPGQEEALRQLVGGSALSAPLVARGRALGAITLISTGPERRYDDDDLDFALELARRAAVAVDNALLFREAEERGQAARILQSVGDGVVLVDGSGAVRYWNRAAERITGISGAAVVDRPAVEAIPGWAQLAPLVPVGGAPQSMPLQVGDRELWLSISGVALEEGTVFAFRDLTEERALDELKTEFVSTVSHELRTPLAAIYGAAMTLLREDVQLPVGQRENLLGVVANEADRLARIVNDILWASRLDSGTLRVAIESCDAVDLAGKVVSAQTAHLPEGIALSLEAQDDLPEVAADGDKVRQVLVNLVDNAVKYSPDGGRTRVVLNLRGAHVRIAVSDEGLGIPYGEQRRIFDKFYRLDPNLTRGVGGTGLGLYICRELVRRMNGRIWVVSEPGRGSTFFVELPVAGGEEDVRAHLRRA